MLLCLLVSEKPNTGFIYVLSLDEDATLGVGLEMGALYCRKKLNPGFNPLVLLPLTGEDAANYLVSNKDGYMLQSILGVDW